MPSVAQAITWLRTPEAVRERCQQLYLHAKQHGLEHFTVHEERLEFAAGLVIEATRERYPSLRIPPHSRWRHFGNARCARLDAAMANLKRAEAARAHFDLALISVLLDAGAGSAWHYVDPSTGERLTRSEGLAVASLRMFEAGVFSNDPHHPWRVDAEMLTRLQATTLAAYLQVTDDNPLVGLAGRCTLLHRLGAAMLSRPESFGEANPRLGNLFDRMADEARDGHLSAGKVLSLLLDTLSDVWPEGRLLMGRNIGDVGYHEAIRTNDVTDAMVPFHKLSQWLTYSLIEPLETAQIRVTDRETLTGLAEYRNGGLLIDSGVLRLRDPQAYEHEYSHGSQLVVEWRALTVSLLEILAKRVRERFGVAGRQLSMASILEGGTWAAGRRIAQRQRRDGGPPLRVRSAGTVF